VLFDDFLGDPQPVLDYLHRAAGLGVRGALMQVLDPDEEAFPWTGAVLFRSASGALSHDTRDAGGLREAYLARLAERRELLGRAALNAGWHFGTHDTAARPRRRSCGSGRYWRADADAWPPWLSDALDC
jgi:uncharacterized protein (DUF58 family)